jgi:solute carrier family 35 protein E1
VAVWTGIYYATSAASGLWNKALVEENSHGGSGVSPTVLTFLHLLVSLGSDVAIMRYWAKQQQQQQHQEQQQQQQQQRVSGSAVTVSSRSAGAHDRGALTTGGSHVVPNDPARSLWSVVVAFTPISVFVITSKLTTYMSYQHVSMALSHTAKATEPIFNVLVAALLFGELHSTAVYTSLVPIALGVTLASVTDLSYNNAGFFWATASALTKVLQNIYTKKIMDTGKFTFWEIHLYCGAASLAILLPLLLGQVLTADTNPFSQ